jgi:hypothetical protein
MLAMAKKQKITLEKVGKIDLTNVALLKTKKRNPSMMAGSLIELSDLNDNDNRLIATATLSSGNGNVSL